jgi:hypothetical protein
MADGRQRGSRSESRQTNRRLWRISGDSLAIEPSSVLLAPLGKGRTLARLVWVWLF